MSESVTNLAEWIVVLAFFSAVIGSMFAEAGWLSKKGWADFGKAFIFSALSNTIGIGIGFFIGFAVLMIFMMFALENPLKDSPYENAFFVGLAILGIVVSPVVLMLCKRIFLAILKICPEKSWRYSLLSSVLILLVSLGAPLLIGYVIFKLL